MHTSVSAFATRNWPENALFFYNFCTTFHLLVWTFFLLLTLTRHYFFSLQRDGDDHLHSTTLAFGQNLLELRHCSRSRNVPIFNGCIVHRETREIDIVNMTQNECVLEKARGYSQPTRLRRVYVSFYFESGGDKNEVVRFRVDYIESRQKWRQVYQLHC